MANDNVIRTTRRKLGFNRRRARLGNGSGVVYVPGRPGYVYIRFSASNDNTDALTPATAVRLRANIAVANDLAVIVAHDTDGILSVVETDFQALEQSGSNPLSALQTNQQVNGSVDLNQSPILRSQPVGGSDPLSVSVLPFMFVSGTTFKWYAGEKIDLTSSIPGTSDFWGLAGIFLKTDLTTEIVLSTPQETSEPLDDTDIQECVTGASDLSIPIVCWKLTNGQTEIVDSDKFFDARQWINIPQSSGAGSSDDTGIYMGAWW